MKKKKTKNKQKQKQRNKIIRNWSGNTHKILACQMEKKPIRSGMKTEGTAIIYCWTVEQCFQIIFSISLCSLHKKTFTKLSNSIKLCEPWKSFCKIQVLAHKITGCMILTHWKYHKEETLAIFQATWRSLSLDQIFELS